jgi:hypothetical protein
MIKKIINISGCCIHTFFISDITPYAGKSASILFKTGCDLITLFPVAA